MASVSERRNNLWDRVESRFDRMQSQFDSSGEDMRQYAAGLTLSIRDVWRANSEALERLSGRMDLLTVTPAS